MEKVESRKQRFKEYYDKVMQNADLSKVEKKEPFLRKKPKRQKPTFTITHLPKPIIIHFE